jgi:hypothetical protein
MKGLCLVTAIFLMPLLGIAQNGNAAKTPEFVLVFITAPYYYNGCMAYYSDSTVEDLISKLNLPEQKHPFGRKENYDIVREYKFKILEYMYGKGYELLSATDKHNSGTDFYFKHK